MALTVLTPASTRRLTTLEHLEDDLGIETVQGNAVAFERLIDRASGAVERYCGRIFAQQRYLEIVHAINACELILSRTPIVSVASIESDGEALTGWRIEHAEAGILYHYRGWGWNTGYYEWSTGGAPFEWDVTYVAGYILPEQTTPPDATGERLPADIEQAVIEAIKVWHHEAVPSTRVSSRHWEDQSISYHVSAGKGGLPVMAQRLLLDSGWRRVAIR